MSVIVRPVCLSFVLFFAATLVAQDAGRWKNLSNEDFVQQGIAELKAKSAEREAIELDAKRRLLETDATTTASYPVLDQLSYCVGSRLSAEDKLAVLSKLQTRSDAANKLAFDDMQGRYGALLRLSGIEAADKELLAWIDAQDLAALEVPQLEQLCFRLGQTNKRGDRLQIEWKGFLRPEKQGRYTFSPSRIRTDRDYMRGRIRSAMKVTLDGAEIINTAKNGWHTESQPLLLDNSRDLPIEVSFVHERDRRELGTSCPGIAMLCWKGPGIDHQLVPTAALKPMDGKGHGLSAEYSLIDVNPETRAISIADKATRVDPQVDLCWWRSGNTGFRPHNEQRTKVINHLISRYTEADFLTAYRPQINPSARRELNEWRQVAELATSDQREKFLEGLLANRKFIESLRLLHVRRLQHFLQTSNEKTLDLYSIWLPLQKDPVPQFLPEPRTGDTNMRAIAEDTMMLPGGITYLRDHCVARSDGSCCLSAAYVAAYGSQWEGKLEDYCNWLDERLGDLTLGGDQRVGWLIARSMAEGLRGNQIGHHYINNLNGLAWLVEALETAESEPVELQAARHQAARLLDAGEKTRLKETMKTFEQQFASDAARAELAQWREQLGKLGVGAAPPQQLSEKELTEYLDVLKFRAENAESRGDNEALARYRALIAKLEAK